MIIYNVAHYPQEKRYVLLIEKQSFFWSTVARIFNKPFRASGYNSHFWGNLWDWSYHKNVNKSKLLHEVKITRAEALKISPDFLKASEKIQESSQLALQDEEVKKSHQKARKDRRGWVQDTTLCIPPTSRVSDVPLPDAWAKLSSKQLSDKIGL